MRKLFDRATPGRCGADFSAWRRSGEKISRQRSLCCVRPLSLFYSDASVDGVEERSRVPRSRAHARLKRKATKSHDFSYVQPTFIDL
ncbi:hypothetical protein EVAR_49950_1 [Eumeta japonica]|uniref:Uncharacterized protein n=1 Tax=Eumeta variegata TaxID=151549 RepID=A0A4C1XXR6_EUMVA|nr:hypothetical protein EVAR_49950_1 [Eumeta japonica]